MLGDAERGRRVSGPCLPDALRGGDAKGEMDSY